MFSDQADKESVWIVLSEYHLDSIPPDIGRLKKAKRLFISRESGWTIYPPLSTIPTNNFQGKQLPDELTGLSNLTRLNLIGLDLERLPADFGELKNLDSLDLSFNSLVIRNEIAKLKRLERLRFLGIAGNIIDSTVVHELERENPSLKVKWD